MNERDSLQHQAWTSGVASNKWFERNREALDANRPPSRSTWLYASHIKPGQRVLEIGSANGRVLEQLRRLTGCEAHGIDPSPVAIDEGRSGYPELHLSVGTADKIEYPDGFFDAILFGFCLYLIERALLMRVVAESDRALSERHGVLMITDFDPVTAHRRPFKHHDGLWTYKMDYSALWLANPQYVLAEKASFSHHGDHFHEEEEQRVAAWILVKQGQHAYPDRQ